VAALVIIPARYGSTRFPGKPLAPLKGKPVIQHVYENAVAARLARAVVVATDSEEIAARVSAFGGRAVMTSGGHASGTDRAAEAAASGQYAMYDIIVNVQGDEPLIRHEMVDAVVELLDDERASVSTLARKTGSPDDMLDPNVVKVVLDAEGFALYFSRAPVPYQRDTWKDLGSLRGSRFEAHKHIGIYGYRRDALMRLTGLPQSALERAERLEQLRALENGFRIKVGITPFDTIGVDTPKDLERVEKCLSSSS
jgi:3-deoxy-manno-octulosonate cytidylyltransferase (CMP-KDO synthetase)